MGSLHPPGATGDRELWLRASDGDTAAFGELFSRHASAVYNHLFRRVADWSEAEDLTSAVFLQAWRVGSVTITGSNRDTVAVTETLSYRGYPPVTTRSLSGGVLTLNYRCRSDDCGVAYDIEVPRSLSVRVDADTAPISLTSLAGQVHASSDVGSIRGRNLSGAVADLRTNVGSIEASFRSAPSHLSANADTGSVTLLVPAAPGYAVTASADVGSVSVTVRRDASSDHVIEAFADVGSVTVAGS
jgi:hypothetical protein